MCVCIYIYYERYCPTPLPQPQAQTCAALRDRIGNNCRLAVCAICGTMEPDSRPESERGTLLSNLGFLAMSEDGAAGFDKLPPRVKELRHIFRFRPKDSLQLVYKIVKEGIIRHGKDGPLVHVGLCCDVAIRAAILADRKGEQVKLPFPCVASSDIGRTFVNRREARPLERAAASRFLPCGQVFLLRRNGQSHIAWCLGLCLLL